MELSIAIPQEIIEEIIAHLFDDLPTLKCCATAARSLFLASRKHIFSTVRLYQPSDTRNLQSLLDQSPDIATLISTLHVYPWDVFLSLVLPSLSHLRHLVIGSERDPIMNWRALPQRVKNTIEDLIKSPTLHMLHMLHFKSIIYLPISIIPLAAHVKVLKLDSVRFTECDARHQVWGHPNPMQVESIHLFNSSTNLVCPPLLAPHLRRGTIQGNSLRKFHTIRRIFAATEPEVSIQDLTWLEYRGNDSYTDPAVLSHLRRLALVTQVLDEYRFATIAWLWASIAELLKYASLGNLEEFSITVRSDSDRYLLPNTGEGDMCLGATGTWWDGLDTLLGDSSQAPKLCLVIFCIQVPKGGGSVSGDALALQIGKRLPLLHHAGKLSTMFSRCSMSAIEM